MPPTPGFQPPSPVEQEALAAVPRSVGMDPELLRVSIETARRYPRDEAAILRTLVRAIATFPTLAERFIYAIPYKDRGQTVYVEGLTVRAAETLASEWGHFWVNATITAEADDWIDVQATAFDAQKNLINRLPFRVSRFEKGRDGTVRVLDERRMLQALQSGISKASRNATLKTIPIHVKEAFEEAVREALAGGPLAQAAEKTRVEACIASYAERFQVTQAQLETRIGRGKAFWIGRDLSALRALFAALVEGETTVADAFPGDPTVTASSPIQTNGGTVADAADGQTPGATPPPVVADPPPATAAEPQAERTRRARKPRATPYVAPPPTPGPAPDPTVAASLDLAIATCETPAQLSALINRIYAPDSTLTRDEKRRAAALVEQKRDALQGVTP